LAYIRAVIWPIKKYAEYGDSRRVDFLLVLIIFGEQKEQKYAD